MNIKRRHLYLADLNPRAGTESGKLRPVLVVQNDLLNEIGHPSTWVLPCTTQITKTNLLRVRLSARLAGNDKECDVMVDQSRAIDNRRLVKTIGEVPREIFSEVIEKLKRIGGF
jgi:mRNA interferase MazF